MYRVRVLALFLDVIRDAGYLQDTNSSKLQDNKAVAIMISRLSPAQFIELTETVRRHAFIREA
jgi:hypothetical protein